MQVFARDVRSVAKLFFRRGAHVKANVQPAAFCTELPSQLHSRVAEQRQLASELAGAAVLRFSFGSAIFLHFRFSVALGHQQRDGQLR